MAIKLIRICERCGRECERDLEHFIKRNSVGHLKLSITVLVEFQCSDCILKEAREIRRQGQFLTKRSSKSCARA